MTKFQLCSLLFASGRIDTVIQGHSGYITSIQREDGSGSSFNVIMWDSVTERLITLYVRTID